jgi:hypothetical protein
MVGINTPIVFWQQCGDMTHDFVCVTPKDFIAVLAGEGR